MTKEEIKKRIEKELLAMPCSELLDEEDYEGRDMCELPEILAKKLLPEGINRGFNEGYELGRRDIISCINKYIIIQRQEYERCKELRNTRMRNADKKNWGMINAEDRIEHAKEILLKIPSPWRDSA